jgi:hypothetical protein
MDDVDFVNLMLGVCHCASQSPIGAVATPGLNEIYSISRPMKKTARNSSWEEHFNPRTAAGAQKVLVVSH